MEPEVVEVEKEIFVGHATGGFTKTTTKVREKEKDIRDDKKLRIGYKVGYTISYK
jgi:hypothetical protein